MDGRDFRGLAPDYQSVRVRVVLRRDSVHDPRRV